MCGSGEIIRLLCSNFRMKRSVSMFMWPIVLLRFVKQQARNKGGIVYGNCNQPTDIEARNVTFANLWWTESKFRCELE